MVERHYGIQPLIYSGQNFYNKYLTSFSGYRFMIAKYSSESPILKVEPRFMMWQYSATGRIPGIKGNVDRSCFMDHYDVRDILIK